MGKKDKAKSRVGKAKPRTRPYPYEFRIKMVRLYLEEGYSTSVLREQFGVSCHSVQRWVKAYHQQGTEGLVAKLPSEVQPVWNAVACRTGYVTTLYAEWSVLEDSEAQVRASGPVGDIPLVVLSSSTVDLWAMPPGYPLDELVALHMDLQRKLAALAPDSTHIVVEDSGHYIQLDQPQVVVDAILDVVEAARAE